MKKSELNPAPDLSAPVIPVICDQCRAAGMAGDEAFAGIPDLLDFEPVPRRAHVNNWTADHQRAFIAALALTGSPARAARTLGRHAFGAEQLRKAKGGRGFSDAWDAAMDVAKERELARIHANLEELAANSPSPLAGEGRGEGAGAYAYDDDEQDSAAREHDEVLASIRRKLLACRRLYLAEISADPARRAAWEVLCGPVDWESAAHAAPQDNEPEVPNMRRADMVLTVASGWTGAHFGTEEEKAEVDRRMERLAIDYERRGGCEG